jgi:protein associated with RNAse G/E
MSDKQEFQVIRAFRDKGTMEHHAVGSVYSADEERLEFLRQKGFLGKEVPVKQEEVDEDEFPKHTGGGWYEISSGEKVQGKEEAEAAEKELNKEGE